MDATLESVLTSSKKLIGIDEYDDTFDSDIIIFINSVFSALNQMGAGPTTGFFITDDKALWTEFSTDIILLGFVKSFVYLKVKLAFDPPQSSAVIESMKYMIAEQEWRITQAAEPTTV